MKKLKTSFSKISVALVSMTILVKDYGRAVAMTLQQVTTLQPSRQ